MRTVIRFPPGNLPIIKNREISLVYSRICGKYWSCNRNTLESCHIGTFSRVLPGHPGRGAKHCVRGPFFCTRISSFFFGGAHYDVAENNLTATERKYLQSANKKIAEGKPLSDRESRAVEKYKRIKRKESHDDFVANFPAAIFFDAVGDTDYKIAAAIKKFGIPIPPDRKSTGSLAELLAWFYKHFRDGKVRTNARNLEDLLLREKYRQEKIKRLRAEKRYVPVEDVMEILYRFGTVLRITGERLGQRYGDDVIDEINDAVEEAREHIKDILTLNDDKEPLDN